MPACVYTVDVGTRASALQLRKQELVRNTIWDAAIELFRRQGFEQTTVDEIAGAAGVSRRSFFRYFGSKDDLMGEGIVSYGTALCAAIDGSPKSWSLLEVLHCTVLEVASHAAAHPRTLDVMHVVAASAGARQAQRARWGEMEERVASAYAKRFKTRASDPMPRLLAGLTFSILDVTFRSWFTEPETDISTTVERVFGRMQQLLCSSAAPVRQVRGR